jgi:hypothetical protein
MVMRTQICRRELPRESWTTVQVRLNPARDANDGRVNIWVKGEFCGCAYRLCRPNIVPMETAEPSD